MGKNVCGGCDLTFGSLGAFNAHRVGGYGDPVYKQSPTGKSQEIIGYTTPTRRCLSIEEMVARGFKQEEKHGWWVIDTMDEAALARLKGRKQKNTESADTEDEDEQEESA